MSTDLRVVIAGDHPIFRHGLQQVVERQPDMQVVEAVGDGAAALDAIRRLAPDVAVLDVRMPGLGGFEVATQLADEGLPTRLMFLTMHAEPAVMPFSPTNHTGVIESRQPTDDTRSSQAQAPVRSRSVG